MSNNDGYKPWKNYGRKKPLTFETGTNIPKKHRAGATRRMQKILTSAHIKEHESECFKVKGKYEMRRISSELISIPKFEGNEFYQKQLKQINSRVRPEFKVTTKNGRLNSYIIILDKNDKEMKLTINRFKRQGRTKDAMRLQKIARRNQRWAQRVTSIGKNIASLQKNH